MKSTITTVYLRFLNCSGGTLQASLWRIVGTVVGALVGWAALESGSGSAYVLGAFAVLLGKLDKNNSSILFKLRLREPFFCTAIPFFYIHLGSTYNRVGIVVLVSYVIIALVRYSKPSNGSSSAETVW